MSSDRGVIVCEDSNTDVATQPIFTPTELILPEDTSFEDWTAIGQRLQRISRSIHFWIGDWIKFGERKWGERYAQAMEETPFAQQTLMNDVWVCSKFHSSRRREELTFNHHAVVAALPPAEQDEWLDTAEREGWSSRQLWAESRGAPPLHTLYNGPATVGGPPRRRVAALPIGATLDAQAGDEVHITIKEATNE